MPGTRATVLVTGLAGNLGTRLLAQLADWDVVGVDLQAPSGPVPARWRFEPLDLGQEAACRRLVGVLRESGASAVVHLAFVIDPLRTGVLDRGRMWQINVADR